MRQLAILVLFLTGLSMAGALLVSGVVAPPDGPPRPGLDRQPGVPAMTGDFEATGEQIPEVVGEDLERRLLTRVDEVAEELDGPVLLVVDKESGLPVAGAEVAYADSTTARAKQLENPGAPISHPSELAERYGAIRLTGPDGKVRIPEITVWTVVVASHEDKFAWSRLNAGHTDEVRLELEPDQTLQLQVVDPTGAGREGVPLAVYRGSGWGEARSLWRGESSVGGRVTLAHFQLLRQRPGGGNRFAAALRLPVGQPSATEFTADPLPSQPVKVLLPATGQLRVTLVDGEGREVLAGGRLTLLAARAGDLAVDLPLRKDFDSMSATKAAGERSFSFPYVGLGLQLQPTCRLDGGDRKSWAADPLVGPASPDEVIEVRITMPSDITLVSGILQDLRGNPVSGISISVQLDGADGRIAGSRVTPNAEGWFEIAARLHEQKPPFALQLQTPRTPDQAITGLRVEPLDLQLGQRNDLGTLRLEDLQIIARGLVTDELGEPIPNAVVSLQRYQIRGNGRPGRPGPGKPDQTPTAGWHRESLVRTRADAEGRFKLLGKVLPGRLRLQAYDRSHIPGTTEEIIVGEAVDIQLMRAGSLSGEVAVPLWLSRMAVRPVLRPRDDPESSRGGRMTVTEGVGRFRFDRLPAGVHDLFFELRGFDGAVLEVSGIPIVAGDNGDNPQLQGLDLRPFLHRFEVRALGTDGSEPAGGNVSIRYRGAAGEEESTAFILKNGRAEFVMPEATVDLTVLAEGYQPKQVKVLEGEQDVYLERSPTVLLMLPGLRSIVGPDRKVRIVLRGKALPDLPGSLRGFDQASGRTTRVDGGALGGGSGWLGADDTVSVPLSAAGDYEVSLQVQERGSKPVSLGSVPIALRGAGPVLVPIDHHRVAGELGLDGR